ncbi:MAG TPA: amidase [Gaiellaceae bacterium]|nr:amidase [Gaiellaceae bacterium]
MTASELTSLSALELLGLYRTREASPVDVTEAALKGIETHNPDINAFCFVNPESSLAQAQASERRWLVGEAHALDGVPVAVKDVFLTAGWPTLRGSRTVDPGGPWDADAPVVERLRRHGAVLIGKTTTPEFGWKAVTDSPLGGITRNPWNHGRTAGGSSGGSAAAVALGIAPLALGTDGGGSIRIPAAFCGTVGFKPTFGMLPLWPASPFGTLAHAGPLAWTVTDAALLTRLLAGPDSRDWTSLSPDTRGGELEMLTGELKGVRIAFAPQLGDVPVDSEITKAVEQAAHAFSSMGAEVERAEPDLGDALPVFETLWYAGAAKAVTTVASDQLDPGLREVAEIGALIPVVDYVAATIRRAELGSRLASFHERYDLLLTPTVPISAFAAGLEVPPDWHAQRWPTWTPLSYPFNLTQQPAISVPCGFTSAGMPIGLQLVGAKYADHRVLQVANAYQAANPLADRRPT